MSYLCLGGFSRDTQPKQQAAVYPLAPKTLAQDMGPTDRRKLVLSLHLQLKRYARITYTENPLCTNNGKPRSRLFGF